MKKYKGMPAVNNDWQGYTKSENFAATKAKRQHDLFEYVIYSLIYLSLFNYFIALLFEVKQSVLSYDDFISAMALAIITGLSLCAVVFVIFRWLINR